MASTSFGYDTQWAHWAYKDNYCSTPQECDPQLALKIKLERFRWHNFQWLEMMAGESFYQEGEESDDDYLDPHYLQTAAELYEMQNQLDASHGYQYPGEVEFELGHNFNPFGRYTKFGVDIVGAISDKPMLFGALINFRSGCLACSFMYQSES